MTVELSVVLPFHRIDDFLYQAIDSVLASNFKNFELIAVADGNARENISNLTDLYRADARVRFALNLGKGLVDGLNTGVELAQGIFIARMDSDDLCMPNRFTEQLKILESKAYVSVVGTQVQYICQHNTVLGFSRYPSRVTNGVFGKPALPQIAHPAAMFRKEQWRQIGGYRKLFSHVEDLDLWNRFLEVGQIENLSCIGLSYRVHSGQVSHSNATAQIIEAYRADIFDCLGILVDSSSWEPGQISTLDVGEALAWDGGNVGKAIRQATFRRRMRAKQVLGYFLIRASASVFAANGGICGLRARPLRKSDPAWAAFARLVEFPISTVRFLCEIAAQKRHRFGPNPLLCTRCAKA